MTRPNQRSLCLLTLGLTTVLAVAPVVSAQVPDLMEARGDGSGPPVWVSAHAATDAQGQMRWNLFDPRAQSNLKITIQAAEAIEPPRTPSDRDPVQESAVKACHGFGAFRIEEYEVPTGTLEDLADHAMAIVSGTVKSRAPGFIDGRPATLLRLEPFRVSQSLRGFALREVYVVYPEAFFWVAGHPFCAINKRFPQLPEVGDAVLAVTLRDPIDRDGNVLDPLPSGLFVQRPHGPIESGRGFQDKKRVSNLDDIESLASLFESLIARGGVRCREYFCYVSSSSPA